MGLKKCNTSTKKKQNTGFFPMLLGTLYESLLGKILTGKDIMAARR